MDVGPQRYMDCVPKPIVYIVLMQTSDGHSWNKYPFPRPSKNLVLDFHDEIYDGTNVKDITYMLVCAPHRTNLTHLVGKDHDFGHPTVFGDTITPDNNFYLAPLGRAQGFYLYDIKSTFSS